MQIFLHLKLQGIGHLEFFLIKNETQTIQDCLGLDYEFGEKAQPLLFIET